MQVWSSATPVSPHPPVDHAGVVTRYAGQPPAAAPATDASGCAVSVGAAVTDGVGGVLPGGVLSGALVCGGVADAARLRVVVGVPVAVLADCVGAAVLLFFFPAG